MGMDPLDVTFRLKKQPDAASLASIRYNERLNLMAPPVLEIQP
jgi:hypothetical protein